jgi:NhaP-type Na+/H+ or K+/H+ antiporter
VAVIAFSVYDSGFSAKIVAKKGESIPMKHNGTVYLIKIKVSYVG